MVGLIQASADPGLEVALGKGLTCEERTEARLCWKNATNGGTTIPGGADP